MIEAPRNAFAQGRKPVAAAIMKKYRDYEIKNSNPYLETIQITFAY
jgi:hypothetical protein